MTVRSITTGDDTKEPEALGDDIGGNTRTSLLLPALD
jgi:hypothetical protein